MHNIKRFITIVALSITMVTLPTVSFSKTDDKAGTIIPNIETYPQYKYSKLVDPTTNNNVTSILLNGDLAANTRSLKTIFNSWKLPYDIVSESPATIKTNWLLWHYDKETQRSYSKPEIHFFTLNVEDRYRFTFLIEPYQQNKTRISLTQVLREKQKDITPDSTYVWLKWQPVKENPDAVHDFLVRLQTEFEKIATSNQSNFAAADNVAATIITPETATPDADVKNYISLNSSINTAWSQLILSLSNKNIALETVDSERHTIQTKWLPVSYDKTKKTLVFNANNDEKHKFKFIVTPGSQKNRSAIFIYPITTKQNNDEQAAMAAEFLNYLQLEK
ncbi:MAG: outer membrane protein assembly factor BamC [Gammaproteobacteria bacterium]|nr:outer membrane protein assembly factor BamC [Gammaproteobacteria bacterium]